MMTLPLYAAAQTSTYDGPQRDAAAMASTYVPIESWVYSAFDRLGAEGYLPAAFFSLRPWTRMDCARLLEEADDELEKKPLAYDTQELLLALKREFAPELRRRDGTRNLELRLESLDQRVTGIAGRPLTDGYHFAQTLTNNYGRPFGEGANSYTGLAYRATAGRFAFYIHGEIQHAAFAAGPGPKALQQIAAADFTPAAAAGPANNFTRGRLLEANVSFTFSNNQLTLGRQSLWWGPARGGTTLFSNNAEPITMLRYDRVRPFELPGFLHYLGPIRAQFLVGRLAGAQYVHTAHTTFGTAGRALGDQPFIHGEKLTFKPTENFEFSVSRTVLFGGAGAPFTASAFARSLFSTGTGDEGSDPGDRRVAFDAQYRIPGLRQCLTGYFDAFAEDQPFPLNYPTESAWIPGAYLRCVPHLPHLTVRAEGLLTPHRNLEFPGFYYFNVHYLSGYTNNRQLIGSWIGREAHGAQVWATWNLSPKSSLEVSGRSMTVDREFLQGGSLKDLRLSADIALHPEWQLKLEEQTEWWRFPLLSLSAQRNAAFILQLEYRPLGRTKP